MDSVMSAQVQQGPVYSHPAIDRFVLALENVHALLQMGLAIGRQVRDLPVWTRVAESFEHYNQRRVEAMIMRDPRISSEIRMAFLRRDSSAR